MANLVRRIRCAFLVWFARTARACLRHLAIVVVQVERNIVMGVERVLMTALVGIVGGLMIKFESR